MSGPLGFDVETARSSVAIYILPDRIGCCAMAGLIIRPDGGPTRPYGPLIASSREHDRALECVLLGLSLFHPCSSLAEFDAIGVVCEPHQLMGLRSEYEIYRRGRLYDLTVSCGFLKLVRLARGGVGTRELEGEAATLPRISQLLRDLLSIE